MPSGHVCIECGEDLSRRRVRREPHYGLPVVACPNCGKVIVRRVHPLRIAWRGLLRIDAALTAIVLHAAMMVGLSLAVIAAVEGAQHEIGQWGFDVAVGRYVPMFIMGYVVMPVLLGAYLTAGYAHWRHRGRAWMIAWAWLAGLLLIGAAVELSDDVGSFASFAAYVRTWLLVWIDALPYLAAMVPAAIAGIPLGRWVLWLARQFRWTRYRWRRRQQRRNQLAQ